MLCGLPRFQASMMMDSVALLSAAYPSNGGQGPGAGMAMLQQQQQQAQLQYATTSSSLLASPDSPLLDGNGQAESKTNLIINYLPQTMSQEEVRSLFASLGDIDSCKLVRDKLTGQSLGYGFVNYVKAEDAIKAVGTLNGLRLQNKTIKVSHARPSSESIKGANLYVSGLPKSMGQSELEGLFKSFGHIITSRILSDNVTGLSKGVGFVRFDTKEQAEQAIAQLNGSIPIGCCEAITVKFANNPAANTQKTLVPDVSQQAAALMPLALLNTAATNYVAAAAAAAAAGGRRLVPSSGPIHHTSQAARFRYSPLASMPTASAGNQADFLTTTALLQMAAASGGSPSTPLVTALSGGSPPSSNGWCIFVYNLAPEMEDAILWQLFGPFGAVLSVKVIRDFASGKCKGYGFVMMAQYEEALSAITALHGTQLGNRTLQVSFKSANQSALLRVQ